MWKGYISFGLVSVPIKLFAAARENHVSFNQLHSVCGSRIRQQIICPVCDRPVERNELSKGYEVEKDVYVTVTGDELKSLETASSDVMAIEQFVSLKDVDPLYFQTSYYTVADEPGRKAYSLLFRSMKQLDLAAIARVSMHSREQVVIIRPFDKGLVLHTLFYADEVREIPEYGRDTDAPVLSQEIALAEQFIKQLSAPFQPNLFHDSYKQKVMDLVDKKREGAAIAPSASPRKLAPVIDLMEALKMSLAAKNLPSNTEAPGEGSGRKPVQPSKQSKASAKRKGDLAG